MSRKTGSQVTHSQVTGFIKGINDASVAAGLREYLLSPLGNNVY